MEENDLAVQEQDNLPTGFENADDVGQSNIIFPTKLITDRDDHENFYILKRDALGKTVKDENGKAVKEIFCPAKIKMVVIGVARGIQIFEGTGPTYAYAGSKDPNKQAIYDKYNFSKDKPENVEEVEDIVGYLIDPTPTGKPELVYLQLKRTSIYKNRRYANFFRENNLPVYKAVTTIEIQKQKSKQGQEYYIPMLGISAEQTPDPAMEKELIDAAIRFSKIEGPGMLADASKVVEAVEYDAEVLPQESSASEATQSHDTLQQAADEVVI